MGRPADTQGQSHNDFIASALPLVPLPLSYNNPYFLTLILINAQQIPMSPSASEKEFSRFIVELMQSIGPVNAKAMFGGYGIFLNGLMFGLIADSVLYLKIDPETETEFTAKGLEPFTYSKKGKEFKMSYYQAPEEVLEDSDAMHLWASKAYGAALRSASKK